SSAARAMALAPCAPCVNTSRSVSMPALYLEFPRPAVKKGRSPPSIGRRASPTLECAGPDAGCRPGSWFTTVDAIRGSGFSPAHGALFGETTSTPAHPLGGDSCARGGLELGEVPRGSPRPAPGDGGLALPHRGGGRAAFHRLLGFPTPGERARDLPGGPRRRGIERRGDRWWAEPVSGGRRQRFGRLLRTGGLRTLDRQSQPAADRLGFRTYLESLPACP